MLVSKIFLSTQLYLATFYLGNIFYTLVKVILWICIKWSSVYIFSLKLKKPVNFEIYWCSSFLTFLNLCVTCWNSLSYQLLLENFMFAKWYWSLEIHFNQSPGNSEISLLLRKSIFSYRLFIIALLTWTFLSSPNIVG